MCIIGIKVEKCKYASAPAVPAAIFRCFSHESEDFDSAVHLLSYLYCHIRGSKYPHLHTHCAAASQSNATLFLQYEMEERLLKLGVNTWDMNFIKQKLTFHV
jgi:hypothetical protein